jgi:hypothetical protein
LATNRPPMGFTRALPSSGPTNTPASSLFISTLLSKRGLEPAFACSSRMNSSTSTLRALENPSSSPRIANPHFEEYGEVLFGHVP